MAAQFESPLTYSAFAHMIGQWPVRLSSRGVAILVQPYGHIVQPQCHVSSTVGFGISAISRQRSVS